MQSIQIGCNTLYPDGRLGNEAQFSLEAQCRALGIIAQAGFHGVEFSHTAHLPDSALRQMARYTGELGLRAWSAHAWTPVPAVDSAIPKALKELGRFVEKCGLLGVQVMVIHAQQGPDHQEEAVTRDIQLAVLRPICQAAAAFGGKVAVENGKSWSEWQYWIDLVDCSGIPNLGLNVDTGHANLGDLGVQRAISAAAHRIVTTHLQDNFGEVDEHLPPGEGKIDWPAALGAFLAVGYPGLFMVEISDCPPNREPDAVRDTQTASRNLRRFLEGLGHRIAPLGRTEDKSRVINGPPTILGTKPEFRTPAGCPRRSEGPPQEL